MPWVRLHGIKDYLDMVEILGKYPLIHQTFNLVPSLIEQIEDYTERTVKDTFLELSYQSAKSLSPGQKEFILAKFFSINVEKNIAVHPRYYELYLKKTARKELSAQDYLDLQVWFNLAWFDPSFREKIPELKKIALKGRFFTEEEKCIVLDTQLYVLEEIISTYKKFSESKQIEITLSPYYHPILPLLCDTAVAKEANPKIDLPAVQFAYPQDAKAQIDEAAKFFKSRFGFFLQGMWPSEEAVSEDTVPLLIDSGIKWIVTDEEILLKSLKLKKRNTHLLYQPHILNREKGSLNIIFRDRNLSDLIGFVYHRWEPDSAVEDFMKHMKNIATSFKETDTLVTIAMDGENAWEYYSNDGHDFLELLYQRLSEADFVKTTTITEYLRSHLSTHEIKHLAAGSWIYAQFTKWIGNPHKNKAWECLVKAREELKKDIPKEKLDLAWKQMYIAQGSDWFWWYGDEDTGDFDKLFRTHLGNFYKIIGKDIPEYLKQSL